GSISGFRLMLETWTARARAHDCATAHAPGRGGASRTPKVSRPPRVRAAHLAHAPARFEHEATAMLLDDSTLRTSATRPIESDAVHLDWTLALAGGEGVRLQEYVERRFGRRIPKQYCCLLGNRSMLQHTLDRMNRLTPPSRTLTVIGTYHGEIAAPQLIGRSDHVFRQPSSRDTGLALYVAIAMIKRWTPNA